MTSKAKLRRKIKALERTLFAARQAAFSEALAPTYLIGEVILGPTRGGANVISFPILCQDGRRAPRIDLPSMGYSVIYSGFPLDDKPATANEEYQS